MQPLQVPGVERALAEASAKISADADLARAHAELISSRTMQFDLPPQKPPEIPDWARWLGSKLGVLEPFLPAIFWTVVAVGAAIILLLIAQAFWPDRFALPGWLRRAAPADEPHPLQPGAHAARQLLAEADALAGGGQYDEAARRLLARTIEEMDSRLPGEVRPTLTSRELAGSALLPARPAGHFREIVAMVERGLFARRPLSPADWAGCRAAYERFISAEAWAREAAR